MTVLSPHSPAVLIPKPPVIPAPFAEIHILGGGLAGLYVAVTQAARGRKVHLYEAGPQAGGRARSFFDKTLDTEIDNGNHLILSGNPTIREYLTLIGSLNTLTGPTEALFPFIDIPSQKHWTLHLSHGRFPGWLFFKNRRVPDTKLKDYLVFRKILNARENQTVANCLDLNSPLSRNFLIPFTASALNTPTEEASAKLLAAVLKQSLSLGGKACLPGWPKQSLAKTFIDPALAFIKARGGTFSLNERITSLNFDHRKDQAKVISFTGTKGTYPLAPQDRIVSALPALVARDLIPGLMTPDTFEPIINIHFRLPLPPGKTGFYGLTGGMSEWVFMKGKITSVTVSAARRYLDWPAEEIARLCFEELRQVLPTGNVLPPFRVIKEKRATFSATPAENRKRPPALTPFANLFCAGDFTRTGLPSTIEGALFSGKEASKALDLSLAFS